MQGRFLFIFSNSEVLESRAGLVMERYVKIEMFQLD